MDISHLAYMDLDRLNSATKYPSIPTYHEIGERGRLTETVQVPFDEDEEVVVTEKVDGTNARIILFPDGDYVIGSREDLLHARGDRIVNATLGIVDIAKPVAELVGGINAELVEVYFGEVYGHGVGKQGKQYSGDGMKSFRLFDIAVFKLDELKQLLNKERGEISNWRKHGGQVFRPEHAVAVFADYSGPTIPVTPRLDVTMPPPKDLAAAYDWLHTVLPDGTHAALDDGAKGNAEGVVVRTKDRSKIAKLRFADYQRTLFK